MKKLLRPLTVALTAAFLVSCTSPYQAQMQAVHNSYMTGGMSDYEYNQRMKELQIQDAGWQQQNANAATTAAVVGVAALGVAALADDNHHHHYNNHYHGGHWHNGGRWH